MESCMKNTPNLAINMPNTLLQSKPALTCLHFHLCAKPSKPPYSPYKVPSKASKAKAAYKGASKLESTLDEGIGGFLEGFGAPL